MRAAKAIIRALPARVEGIVPRWATVTSVAPLRVRFDGETDPLNLRPVDLVGARLGDRVWTLRAAGQLFLVGRPGGAPSRAGIIEAFGGPVANVPPTHLPCLGQTVSRTAYPRLFAAIGTTHGNGDGSTTFGLPNGQKRTLVGQDASDARFTTIGQTGGTTDETLTAAQLPSHTHGPGTGATNFWGWDPSSGGGEGTWNPTNATKVAGVDRTGAAGGGQSHNNLPPYLVSTWIININ